MAGNKHVIRQSLHGKEGERGREKDSDLPPQRNGRKSESKWGLSLKGTAPEYCTFTDYIVRKQSLDPGLARAQPGSSCQVTGASRMSES